jgi:flagellar motor protein MotB
MRNITTYSKRPEPETPWLSFTDLLSNALILLSLVLVFSTIARTINERPPVIQLPDNEKFRFSSGDYRLSPAFLKALDTEKIPQIRRALTCFGVDTVDIIGHTDGQPNTGRGNLDSAFLSGKESLTLRKEFRAGSNVDLGLLRAIAVQKAIESKIGEDLPNTAYRVYSAGSVINTDGVMEPVTNRDDRERRRIEIRFTRSKETTYPKSC